MTMPETTTGSPVEDSKSELDHLLNIWKEEYNNPALITEVWREFFREVGLEIGIADLNWSEGRIAEPVPTLNGPISGLMVPNFFTGYTEEDLLLLARAFPEMRNLEVARKYVHIPESSRGWVKVEGLVAAPNRGTNQEKIERFAIDKGLQGQRLTTYVLASQMSERLNGQLFDSAWTTTTRLPGTFFKDGRMVGAKFYSNKDIHLVSVMPKMDAPAMGARFEMPR